LTYQGGTNSGGVFTDDTASLPASVGVMFSKPEWIDHIIVFAAQPWQQQGTMTDFDIQTLDDDGTAWHTVATYVNDDGTERYAPNDTQGTGCTYDMWFNDNCIWDAHFPIRKALGVRVYARACTYGNCISLNTVNAQVSGPSTTANKITCARSSSLPSTQQSRGSL
jgi:hypothetical protein